MAQVVARIKSQLEDVGLKEVEVDGDELGKLLQLCGGEELSDAQVAALFREVAGKHNGTIRLSDFVDFIFREGSLQSGGEDEEPELAHFGEEELPRSGQDTQRSSYPPEEQKDEVNWFQQYQECYDFQDQHCTLTVLHSGCGDQLKLALHRPASNDHLDVECDVKTFEALCQRHKGLSGPAQTNAAIRQLLQEASQMEPPQEGPQTTPAEEEADDEVDHFGEEEEPQAVMEGWTKVPDEEISAAEWLVNYQEAWDQEGQHCTLTVFTSPDGKSVKFELHRPVQNDHVDVSCTKDYFEALCQKQGGSSGPVQTNAAIAQLFEEALARVRVSATASAEEAKEHG